MYEIDPFAPECRRKKKDSARWHLSGRFKTLWVEDTYPIDGAAGHDFITHGASHVGTSLTRSRARWLFISVCSLLLFLGVRLIWLQLIQGNEYRKLAINNSERLIPIPAERGLFFDRRGVQLVENIPSFSLYLLPQDLPRDSVERREVIAHAAALSGKSVTDIQQLIDEYKAYTQDSIVIKEDIDYDAALQLQVASTDVPSIFIAQGSKRWYGMRSNASSTSQLPSSLSAVLGYMGKLNATELQKIHNQGYTPADFIGKTGVEQEYESYLRGVHGRRRIQVNVRGKEQSILAEVAPVPGKQIQLAIDLQYQKKLQDIMQAYVQKNGKKRAAGIVMNPNTGEILALVNLPTFNNNDFSGGISSSTYKKYLDDVDHPLFNRAISGQYPSGSTIKSVVAAAALEEKIIDRSTTFLSNGGLRVGQWFFPDWKSGGHGITNVTKSLAWSVNTFYYYIGGGYGSFNGLGVDRLTGYLRRFGMGSLLGIDLPGEVAGFVPSKAWKQDTKHESWYIGDTYNLSIGQGDLLVTPLQIAVETSAIANGGKLLRPRVVSAIIDPETNEHTIIKPQIIRGDLASPETIAIVRDGMRECVVYGSCRQLSNLPVMAAGKTGTAQWNSAKPNHAWFTSFAPYDKPEITVTVLVEEGGEGSGISAPIAYDFYAWWWRQKNS
jgi:penicillin-binding protein 2